MKLKVPWGYDIYISPHSTGSKAFGGMGKNRPEKTLEKIARLLEEITLHPTTGTGQVEQLRGNLSGFWSRRINKADRIIYSIEEDKVIVTVISMKGHY